ncbi:MAG: hypothetical protein RR630_01175 [Coprobacillus sp.]
MKKDEYKKEIDSICASEQFKNNMKHNILNVTKPKRKFSFHYKIASLLIVSCLILMVLNIQDTKLDEASPKEPPTNEPIDNEEKPEEPSNGNHIGGDGFGFSGVMLKDASELKHNSAYNLSKPSKTMSIYKSQYKKDNMGIIKNPLNSQEKINILKKYAKLLKFNDYTIEKPLDYYYHLIDKKGVITFEEDSIYIEFSSDYKKSNRVDMNVDNMEEAKQIVENLYKQFKDVVEIDNPQIDYYYDYNIDGQKHWTFQLSKKTDNQNESLINQTANVINFYRDDQGIFSSFRISFDDVEVVKDVPIISLEEAKQKFNDRQYFTSLEPFESKGIGYIEMKYLLSSDGLYLPYYLFYALSDEKNDNGCQTYVLCYVSALPDNLKKEYNVPTEIQFN